VLKITDPGLPTRLDLVVNAPAGEPLPDAAALRGALAGLLSARNTANAAEPALGEAARTLGYGELVATLALPGVAAGATDPAPYTVQVAVTTETGLSQILAASGAAYTLTPLERLALAGVEVLAEA
jgi:hypothetical protein